MVPVLKLFITAVAVLLFLVSQSARCFARSSSQNRKINVSESADSSAPVLDDEARNLLANGKPGFLIENVRSEVLSLLSESNSCTGWFLSAEPAAQEKFRSLHFALDVAGAAEILKIDEAGSKSGYYHPYVASTRQNVGPGSVITLNANGAFFRSSAFVRNPDHPAEHVSAPSYGLLGVGNYAGGSPEAQLLTILHEFGHIVNLLPVDAGVPAAPFISIQNTETVQRHCRPQIKAHAKHLHITENSAKTLPFSFAYAAGPSAPQLSAAKEKRSLNELSHRTDRLVKRPNSKFPQD